MIISSTLPKKLKIKEFLNVFGEIKETYMYKIIGYIYNI